MMRRRGLGGGRCSGRDAELRLWSLLQRYNNDAGYHFRRRATFRSFLVDFVDHDILLAIELVGGEARWRPSPDVARTYVLRAAGYTVLRFWRDEVSTDFDRAAQALHQVLEDRPPKP